jgi:hypothetical protein
MPHFDPAAYAVGVAFWLFIGAVAVAGIVADYKRRRLPLDLLRAMVEKGQPLDPALVAKLMPMGGLEGRINPVYLKLGGIITIAAGVGVAVMSYFISRIAPVALYPILGSGIVVICIGVGLIIGSKVVADAQERETLHKPQP